MKNRLTTALAGLLALGAAGLTSSSSTAHAADNTVYGEVRFGQLPLQGKMAHAPWVGSWWAYTRNGISHRHKLASAAQPAQRRDFGRRGHAHQPGGAGCG